MVMKKILSTLIFLLVVISAKITAQEFEDIEDDRDNDYDYD